MPQGAQLLSLVLPQGFRAECSRGQTGEPAEVPGESALIAEPGGLRDMGQTIASGREEVKGFVDPHFHDQLARGEMEESAHELGEMMG
jgi:hypothetical protein